MHPPSVELEDGVKGADVLWTMAGSVPETDRRETFGQEGRLGGMADLRRADHLEAGDVVVHASGKTLFEVVSVHGGDGAGFEVTVRRPDGTEVRRRWEDADSVWVMVAG